MEYRGTNRTQILILEWRVWTEHQEDIGKGSTDAVTRI